MLKPTDGNPWELSGNRLASFGNFSFYRKQTNQQQLMARHEFDREDLMREATALRYRIEFEVPGKDEPIVAGFHDDDRFSIYFGPDPVFHFNAIGQLRRAYLNGELYRTQGNTLARLTRQRTKTKTELIRRDLTSVTLQEFHDLLQQELGLFSTNLTDGNAHVLRQMPTDEDIYSKVQSAVQQCLQAAPWLAPPIKATS